LLFAGFSSQIEIIAFYNMFKAALHRCACASVILLLPVFLLAQQETQPLPLAAQDLVQQILSRSGSPSTIAITFQNVSGLPQQNHEAIQNAIFTAFRNANVRVVKPEQAAVQVQISFSDDWHADLWIATIQQGTNTQTLIKTIPRQQQASAASAPLLTLRKIPVWQQDSQILDFFEDNQNLLLLEPGQLSLYTSDSGQWRLRQTLGIPHQRPWPRDLRGRLHVRSGHIEASLPGTRCTGSISPPLLDCRASDDPWTIEEGLTGFFSPQRNFFTGLLAGQNGGASVGPFFSGASWQIGDQRMWLFTGTDGRARLFQNDLGSPAATYNGWGSTVAAVHSICGSGWQLLSSSARDTSQPDSIQAFEITGREAMPVSAPVEFSGPLQALWPAGNYNQVVNGVVQSLVTGKYEAFTLTIICNQ
jgi:hypothetical protein